jgi:hypothetical protein
MVEIVANCGCKKMTPHFARKMPKEKYMARNTAMVFVTET